MNSNIFKALVLSGFSFLSLSMGFASPENLTEKYQMKTAFFDGKDVIFASPADLEEVISVGFFRIKRPENINIDVTRQFARTFHQDPKYKNFGAKDPVNGFIEGELAQVLRFTLEMDHWNKLGWGDDYEFENPNYSAEIQEVGNQLKAIGMACLQSILNRFGLPEKVRFQATGGAAYDEGSYYLNFNYYDPNTKPDMPGLGAHTDWGLLTILDVVDEGLEAEIRGQWMPLQLEEGYLTVNFGEILNKLLPGVNACVHRVITQTTKPRTSTVLFFDARVGPYRLSAGQGVHTVGMVYDWDEASQKLIHGIPTTDFFAQLSQNLYGKLNQDTQQ